MTHTWSFDGTVSDGDLTRAIMARHGRPFSFSFDTPRQSILDMGDHLDVAGVVCRIVGVQVTFHSPTVIDLGDGTRMVTDATVDYDLEALEAQVA